MTKHSCRTASIFSLIPMLLHPLWSTPQTNLNLPRFPVAYSFHITAYDLPRLPVAYSFPHQSLRPNKASLSITLSLTATHTIAYDLSSFNQTCPNCSHPRVQPLNSLQVLTLQSTFHSLRPDFRNAVSPIGYLQHPGKQTIFGHLLSSDKQNPNSFQTNGLQELFLWVYLFHVIGHVRHSILGVGYRLH